MLRWSSRACCQLFGCVQVHHAVDRVIGRSTSPEAIAAACAAERWVSGCTGLVAENQAATAKGVEAAAVATEAQQVASRLLQQTQEAERKGKITRAKELARKQADDQRMIQAPGTVEAEEEGEADEEHPALVLCADELSATTADRVENATIVGEDDRVRDKPAEPACVSSDAGLAAPSHSCRLSVFPALDLKPESTKLGSSASEADAESEQLRRKW
jgi:hypothetical protein